MSLLLLLLLFHFLVYRQFFTFALLKTTRPPNSLFLTIIIILLLLLLLLYFIIISILRANVCKNRATGGQGQKLNFVHILSIHTYQEVTKRGVVCFSKGRLNLEKIDKINFRGRRLENNKNLRQNEAVSKLRSHAKRKKAW